ncbi:MAG TPA: MFS transporter, partial [Spirochaetota bacterium]|nr:MFS transporter [Spirochaetota bacterium]
LTFISKLMGALATMVFGMVVVAVGYSTGVVITPYIKDGIFFSITILPAISCAIGIIPFLFYPLGDSTMSEILSQLQQQRGSA